MDHSNRWSSSWNDQNNGPPPPPFPPLICYRCKRPGHKYAQCTFTPVGNWGTGGHAAGQHRLHTAFTGQRGHRDSRLFVPRPQPYHRGPLSNGLRNRVPYGSSLNLPSVSTGTTNSGGYPRPSGDRGQPNNVRPVRLEQERASVPTAATSAPTIPSQTSPMIAPTTTEQVTTQLTYVMCNWFASNLQLYSSIVTYMQHSMATVVPPQQPIQQQQPQQHLAQQDQNDFDPEDFDPDIDEDEKEEYYSAEDVKTINLSD